jgi:TonB family protein
MKPTIEELILAVSSSPALATLVKATFAVCLGLGGVVLARRERAAFRHMILAATFGVLLTLPVVSAVAPPIRIAVRMAQARYAPRAGTPNDASTARAVVPVSDGPATPARSPWSLTEFLLAAWTVGAAVFLVPALVGLRQVRRLRRSGLPWREVDGCVDVLLHEELAGPMTCGVLDPAILLPVDAPKWSEEDLRRAIVHEMEHVRRGDWLIHCAARTACAVYWFHPLVWTAWRRLELEAERSCDDAVLAQSEATEYAEQLIAVARRLSTAAKGPLLAMASRADLSARVRAVLDGRQRRGRAGGVCVAAATIAAAAVVLTVSPLRMVAAPQAAVESRGTLRTAVGLVMTDVTVTYPNGQRAAGLGAGDFAVAEDGVPQEIRVFEEQTGYYVVGYYPRNMKMDGAFRKIDIAVKTATAAKVDYRAGYYAMRREDSPAVNERAAGTPAALNIKPPVLLFKKEPGYSDAARRAKYQGTVVLDVEIDASGAVSSVRTQRSLGLGLDESATEAVKQWRFRPATQDGNPVAVRTRVIVSFSLL